MFSSMSMCLMRLQTRLALYLHLTVLLHMTINLTYFLHVELYGNFSDSDSSMLDLCRHLTQYYLFILLNNH